MSSKRKTKTSPKLGALRKLREARAAKPAAGKASKPKAPAKAAKPPARPRSQPSAPASVASISPTRYAREINLDKVIKRREMGDVTGLAKSIDDRGGLISPICIDPQNFLIAGQRRLAAWALSKFRKEPIPVNVLDVDEILAGEWDENAKRKDFTPQESVDLMEALRPRLHDAAKARQAHGKTARGKSAEDVVDPAEKGRTDDHLARYLGSNRTTLNRAKEVVDAARAEPDKFGELLAYMDKTGKVNGPWKRLQLSRQRTDIDDKKKNGKLDLPAGKFDRIVADMPWAYEPEDENSRADGRSVRAYPTMSHKAMCAMAPDIKARAADNCVLFFWSTNYHMPYAYHVLQAWGFKKFPTILTWLKDKIGRGQWLRDQTEHCIIAVRGKPVWILGAQSTVLHGPRRENSRKPDEFYALIDALAPAQRSLELFARRDLPEGWEGFGDQVGTLKDATEVEKNIPENIPTELEALETIDNERPLADSALARLKEQKLVRGSVKPKLTKAGIARLAKLREAEVQPADEMVEWKALAAVEADGIGVRGPIVDYLLDRRLISPVAGNPGQLDITVFGRARLAQLDERFNPPPITVDCRVCSDGNGLCVECLAADGHTFTMTNPVIDGDPRAWATCSCGWKSDLPWDRHGAEQDAEIKGHLQTVVDVARYSDTSADVSVTDGHLPEGARSPESADDPWTIPDACKRTLPEAAE